MHKEEIKETLLGDPKKADVSGAATKRPSTDLPFALDNSTATTSVISKLGIKVSVSRNLAFSKASDCAWVIGLLGAPVASISLIKISSY
jgi:hypothetical protein